MILRMLRTLAPDHGCVVSLVNQSFIDDPYAALFARDTCPSKLEETIKLEPPKLARIAVRTKFFDKLIFEAVHELGIKQVRG